MERTRRGALLGAASLASVSGCLRLIQGGNEPSIPTEATFAFDDVEGGVRVRYTSGPPIVVGNLEIRSSDGEAVRWHELGSTNVTGDSQITTGAAATIGAAVENWGSELTGAERISVLYVSEDATPTTLSTGRPGSGGESTTATTATESGEGGSDDDGSAAGFQDGFEGGSYEDDWRLLWLQSGGYNGPQDGEKAPLNEWTVKETSELEGDRALHLHSDADGNAIVTRDPVVSVDGDFDFEYAFRTPDADNRGVHVDVVDVSEYGSEEDPLRTEIPHLRLGSARRRPANEEAGFNALGVNESVPFGTFEAGETHRIRVERRGDTVTGYHDGSELVSGRVDLSRTELDLSQPHQLAFRSSGAWGDESFLWLDDVSFTPR